MEALILIFGELVFAILAPFVMLIVELIGSVLSLIFSFGARRKPNQGRASRAARVIAMILVGLAILALTAIWVVNSFYFDSSVRYVFSTVEKRSGIATTCQDIDGSLFAGRIDLRDCTIRRPSHPASSFNLSVANVSLDLRITSLLGTAHIDTAEVVGLDGWVKNDRSGPSSATSPQRAERPRRAFDIGQLNVSNVSLELSGVNPDGNPFSLPIEIQQIESRPLRSRLALFDILFRSNASGSIAGAPFEVSTATIQDGRQTAWRAQKVPVANFGALIGGPLSWFSEGSVDVFVDDQWQRGDSLSIDMDWRLEFSDVEVTAPPGTGAFARMASEPLTRYVNGLDGNFPLEFELAINETQFEYRSSLAAAGLWSAVGEAVNNVLATIGVNLEKAADTADALKEGAKSVLDRLRKPTSDNPD
jgi:hypothetical protein